MRYLSLIGLVGCLIAPCSLAQTTNATTSPFPNDIDPPSTQTPAGQDDKDKRKHGVPLSSVEPDRSFIPGLGWVAMNSDAQDGHADKKAKDKDPLPAHCSHFFYGHPQVHGVVGTGFSSTSHYGSGEYVGGAVTATQLLGNCEHANSAISVTVGGIEGRGFLPYYYGPP